jgi:hypothetical protein
MIPDDSTQDVMEFVGFGQYISEFTLNNMPGTRWQAGNTVAF